MKRVASFASAIMLFVLQSALAQPPTPLWSHSYGLNNQDEWAFNLVVDPDGGYALGGFRPQGMAIVRVAADGTQLWSKTLSAEDGRGLARTPGGGYVICGSEYFQDRLRDVIVHWVNADGERWRTAQAGGDDNEYGMSIVITPDGGCMVAAYREFQVDNSRTVLFKFDHEGNTEWQRQYGTHNNLPAKLIVCADGDYVVAGERHLTGTHGETYLMKVNAVGDIQWIRQFDNEYHQTAMSVVEVQGGGYLVTGFGDTYADTLETQVLLFRVDANGDPVWSRVIGDENYDTGIQAVEMADGGFAVAATRQVPNNNIIDAMIYRLDADGNDVWTWQSPHQYRDWGAGIGLTADGNLVLARNWRPTQGLNVDVAITLFGLEP